MKGTRYSHPEIPRLYGAMALTLFASALVWSMPAQAEEIEQTSAETTKNIEKNKSAVNSKTNKKPGAATPEVLETVTVSDARYNRLNPQAGTQADPTYKSEFITPDPVTINTISQEDLETVKFTDAYEVLNRVPGVSMSRNLRFANGGKGYTVNLMDGISVRDPLRGQVSEIENYDTDEIQRIEIIKGPAKALYPSNAFGGVINVITRDPPLTPQNRLWIEGGGNGITDRFRGGGSSTGIIGDLGYRASFNIWDVPSWREKTGRSREVGSAKLSYQMDEVSKLTFRGEYRHEVKSTGSSLTEDQFNADPRQASDYSSYSNREALTFYLDYERVVGKDGFLKASYGVRRDIGFDFASYSGPADNNYLDMDGKITYKHHFNFLDSYFTSGLETVSGNDNSKTYKDAIGVNPSGPVIRHFDINKFQVSPFAELEVSPLPWLHLTGGARYDDIEYNAHNLLTGEKLDAHFARFSPKSGMTIDLPYGQKFWFNYSFGYSPPSQSLLFTNTIADPSLKPELAENFEVGFRGSVDPVNLEYEVAYFDTDISNYVVNEIDHFVRGRPVYRSVNAGKVNLSGLESSIRYSPLDYLRFEVAHTFAMNKYVDFIDGGNDYTGNTVVSSPEHMVNGRVTLMPIDKLKIQFEVNAMTDYYTYIDNAADPNGTYQRPTMFNLRTSYDFGPVDWWLHIINISDERAARVSYSTRGGGRRSYSSIEEPLTIYSGITMKF